LGRIEEVTSRRERRSVLMVTASDPLNALGEGHYLSHLLAFAGGRNVVSSGPNQPFVRLSGATAPSIPPDEVLVIDPTGIIRRLDDGALEGLRAMELEAIEQGRVRILTGAEVVRPGLEAVTAAVRMAGLLHPPLQAEVVEAASGRSEAPAPAEPPSAPGAVDDEAGGEPAVEALGADEPEASPAVEPTNAPREADRSSG
jgi:hypothetical protein